MQISANGIALEIEDHGSPQGEPLLLIMGLGMQLLGWHEDFVANLVARGFRVIRFDNRDIGLSQSFDSAGVPNLALDSLRFALGLRVKSPYTLSDMAADSVAVLDVLGIDKAHVCGASMGGMIAQRLAARYPERVKSLTLMMTSSGARRLPGPSLKVRGAMISRPKDQRAAEHRRALRRSLRADRQPGVSARQGLPARALHALDQALLSPGRNGAADGGDRRRRRPDAVARHAAAADPRHPRRRRSAGAGGRGRATSARAFPGRRSTSSTAWATTCRRSCGRGGPSPAGRARLNPRTAIAADAAPGQGASRRSRPCATPGSLATTAHNRADGATPAPVAASGCRACWRSPGPRDRLMRRRCSARSCRVRRAS